MAEPAIELIDVRKGFGTILALDGFSLTVGRGRVVALVGPNGAGKTTSFRILMGLLRADRGKARVLGQDAWSAPPEHRRRVGYLSVEGFAWPGLSFVRAVAFTSSFFPSWAGPYVEELARTLEVPAGRPFAAMSKGQARKAALALVLGPEPEVLLLDDPAAGLDPAARREMIAVLAGLLRRTGATILFSSHILSDLERLADELCVIVGGRAILHRPVDDLKTGARRLVFRAPEAASAAVESLPGVVRVRREGEVAALTVLDFSPEWLERLRGALGGSLDGVQELPLGLRGPLHRPGGGRRSGRAVTLHEMNRAYREAGLPSPASPSWRGAVVVGLALSCGGTRLVPLGIFVWLAGLLVFVRLRWRLTFPIVAATVRAHEFAWLYGPGRLKFSLGCLGIAALSWALAGVSTVLGLWVWRVLGLGRETWTTGSMVQQTLAGGLAGAALMSWADGAMPRSGWG
ncbi:MAG: ABC transporter ATP-binding protein, partial [Thermoanaerobaculia bacterium]